MTTVPNYIFYSETKVFIFDSEIVLFTETPPELSVDGVDKSDICNQATQIALNIGLKSDVPVGSQQHLSWIKEEVSELLGTLQFETHAVAGNKLMEDSLLTRSIKPFVKISSRKGHESVRETIIKNNRHIINEVKDCGASLPILRLVGKWRNDTSTDLVVWFFQMLCLARGVHELRQKMMVWFEKYLVQYGEHLKDKSFAEIFDLLEYEMDTKHSYVRDEVAVKEFSIIPNYSTNNSNLIKQIQSSSSLKAALKTLFDTVTNDERLRKDYELQYPNIVKYMPRYIKACGYQEILLSLGKNLRKTNGYGYWTSFPDLATFCEDEAKAGSGNSYGTRLSGWINGMIDAVDFDAELNYDEVSPIVDQLRVFRLAGINAQDAPNDPATVVQGAADAPAPAAVAKSKYKYPKSAWSAEHIGLILQSKVMHNGLSFNTDMLLYLVGLTDPLPPIKKSTLPKKGETLHMDMRHYQARLLTGEIPDVEYIEQGFVILMSFIASLGYTDVKHPEHAESLIPSMHMDSEGVITCNGIKFAPADHREVLAEYFNGVQKYVDKVRL